ncbi:hypothetical protein [Rhodanobacter sp. C03]|uniref:hypothetical protein n=1 Tax=Rhodanobacter sp. C03 TaxID=1945858 RepID=UPI0011156B17|nr:hypothetical protein [Rhodanobacter sp. C03]
MSDIRLNQLGELSREANHVQQRQAVLQRRADRLARCAMQCDIEELASRYAWMRVLVMELESTQRKSAELFEQQRLLSVISDGRASGYQAAAREFTQDIKKIRLDRRKGGKAAGEAKKVEAAKWHSRCVEKAGALLVQGRSRRELAGILAPQFEVTPQAVRTVLNKAKVK